MKQPSPPSRATLRDIAKAAGLSHSTVSLALRNFPAIATATRERVHALAREMNYQPNPMGAGLALFKRSSRTVPVQAALAWINAWPDPKKLRGLREFDLYWQGAVKAAEKLGYRLEEFVVNKEMSLSRVEKILLARGINGILIPPHGYLDVQWEGMHWEHFSAVRFGRSLARLPAFHSVTSEQAASGSLAFEKIRERGYERIGYVGFKNPRRVFVAGFLQAQLEIPKSSRLPPLLIFPPDVPGSQQLFATWLEKNKPDAIFTDLPFSRKWLEAAGYRVPEDIGVAGTTVLDIDVDAGIDQHAEEIGRVAVLVLVSIINDNDRGTPPIQREILIKGEWVDGSSLPWRK